MTHLNGLVALIITGVLLLMASNLLFDALGELVPADRAVEPPVVVVDET